MKPKYHPTVSPVLSQLLGFCRINFYSSQYSSYKSQSSPDPTTEMTLWHVIEYFVAGKEHKHRPSLSPVLKEFSAKSHIYIY